MLSIIIPTLNEEKNIEETLNKIEKISNKIDLNIVVVDDSSKDNTLKLVELFKLRGVPTTIFLDSDGKEFARVLGFADFSDIKFKNWIISKTNKNN